MKKKILLSVVGLSLLLSGCGTSQLKQKSKMYKVVSSENERANDQNATSQANSNKLAMNDLSSPKMLAAAIIDFAGNADQNGMWSNSTGVWKDELNSSSEQWTIQTDDNGWMEAFPTRSLPDAGAADSCPTTFKPDENDVDINESGNSHIISKQDIISFINGEYQLPNGQNSNNSVSRVKEIASAIEIKQSAKNHSSLSQNNNGNVDTTKLNDEQVDNWVYQAIKQNDYAGQNPPKDAFTFGNDLDDSNCVTITVRLNDDNSWVRSQRNGIQPGEPDAYVAIYRINSQGNLQENTAATGGGDWKDIDIPYPGN